MRSRWMARLLVLLGSGTLGVSAFAGVPDADRLKTAADEFDAGRRAYKLRDFEAAAAHFENADRDAPSPEALTGAMRSRREAGQNARALTLAAWGLTRYPNDKNFGDFARQLFAQSEKSLYKLSVACSPECTILIDNKVAPFGEAVSSVIYIEPGPHQLVAGWPGGRHRSADVNAIAGQAAKLSLLAPPIEKSLEPPPPEPMSAPLPAPEPEPAAKKEPSGLPPGLFITGLGVTAVLGGATLWSGLDTVKNPGIARVKSDCADWIAGGGVPDQCPTYKDGLSRQLRTNVLLGATGVVGIATTVVALFTRWTGADVAKPEKKDAFIRPVVGFKDGVTIGAVGRF